MKVTIRAPERSLPTNVPYRSDRIASFDAELELPDGTDNHAVAARLTAIRAAQVEDLDRQEAIMRLRYDMQEPRPASALAAAMDLPGFTTADQLTDKAVAPPRKAEVAQPVGGRGTLLPAAAAAGADDSTRRSTPPPDALRDVQDGTADELRRLAGAITAAGGSVDFPLPATEADAQLLVRTLRAKLFDLQQAKPKPNFYGGTSPKAEDPKPLPATTAPAPKAFTAGASMKPGDRRCSHKSHSARDPRHISSREWDASNAAYGEPLCDPHMMERRMNAKPGAKA